MEQTMEIPTAGPETYCRLCLGTDNLRRVFHPGQNCLPDGFAEKNGVVPMLQGGELLEKIYECTNIKLSPSGDADCAICRRCLQAVEDFYHFRVRSKRVNDLIQVNTVVAGGPLTGTASSQPSSTVSNGNESPPTLKIAVNLVPAVKRRNPAKAIDGIRPHRCRYCPKSFRTLTALTEHGNRAHVSNRQHHCPNCLAQFQHAPSLARHMRSRACFAFSKYRCRVCSESFPDRDQWVDHIRVHAKDFPFQCPDCWSQFKHKATLRRHANTVHLLVQC